LIEAAPGCTRIMNTPSTSKIGPGTKFPSVIADGNPEWEITKRRGRGVWEAKCLGEDYGGTVRVFTDAQVRQSVGMSNFFAKNASEHDTYYASLKLGAIVHYHNSFGEFVRCEVVMGTTVHDKKMHKCLKPVALVGAWKAYDLPRRGVDGTITYGYQADKIRKGECFEPNFGSIYETGSQGGRHFEVDPSKLPALDLSVPDITPEAEVQAKLWKAVKAAQAALASEDDHKVGPRERLEAALKMIQSAL